jgi:hypothetical protein
MNISETYDIFEVYFFNLNSKEEVEPRPINTPFVKCLDLLTNDEEYKFVLSATNLCFVSWYSKETMLIYLRELRWHLLCVNNKINFHCQIFSQICNMIQNENSYFIEKLNIGVNSIADLFYAIHEECSNLLRPNFDNKNPNAEQFFTYNGIKYFYGNTVDCFQSLLNMIAKVCFILFIEFLLFLNCFISNTGMLFYYGNYYRNKPQKIAFFEVYYGKCYGNMFGINLFFFNCNGNSIVLQ